MMDREQQMKDYLDGKFFYLTHEGRTECRQVGEGHSPVANFTKNYSKKYMAKGGQRSVEIRRERINWTADQIEWLKDNIKYKSIKTCAAELGIPYHSVYFQVKNLEIKDWQASQ